MKWPFSRNTVPKPVRPPPTNYFKPIPCAFCGATGKINPIPLMNTPVEGVVYLRAMMGICPVCNGSGTATIMDRMES